MKRTKIKGKNQKSLMWPLLAIILVSLLISGSGPGQFLGPRIALSPSSTQTPRSPAMLSPLLTSTPTFTATPTPTPLVTVKVISYNILFGAGVDRKYDDLLSPGYGSENRLSKLVSFINEAKPDVLGIQEANGWDRGTLPVVQHLAEELDMNYYLAQAPNDFHVVLLTKFEIGDMQNLSGKEGDTIFETMRGLRATLLTPDEQSLNIFVVHLDPFSTRIRLCQVDALIDELEPYEEQMTILLGDMNFEVGSQEYMTLVRAGWRLVAVATNIDQIWIPHTANWTSRSLFTPGNFRLGISNHLPVGAEIGIYPTSIPYRYPDQYLARQDC